MKGISYKRHLAKTITWRIVGTLDTVLLSWLISGSPITGLQIGGAEVVTKMILYYLHERMWIKIKVGVKKDGNNSRMRHLIKSITWRFIGTLDTMFLAWLISGDAMVGLQIGLLEVVSKMLLYYLHERAWYQVDYGLEGRKDAKQREAKRE